MEFDYYYGSQADQFSFIRIPRMLLTEETFSSLTLQSKMLYSVLLDRMSLSMKNGWYDECTSSIRYRRFSQIWDFPREKPWIIWQNLKPSGWYRRKREDLDFRVSFM